MAKAKTAKAVNLIMRFSHVEFLEACIVVTFWRTIVDPNQNAFRILGLLRKQKRPATLEDVTGRSRYGDT
jgi:hypothetical protein